MLNGIDVSHYQGAIDWAKVKAAGIDFAYIKATDGINYVDPCVRANMRGCQENAIPYGLYHFLRPEHLDLQIKRSANWWYTGSPESAPGSTLPLVCDAEVSSLAAADVLTFLDAFPGSILYTDPAMLQKWGADASRLIEHKLWLADYRTVMQAPILPPVCRPWNRWTFWQYTAAGRVDGIATPVDLDSFNGTLDGLKVLMPASASQPTTLAAP
jgi:lysozyme